jgi:hypothetical protein
MDDEVDGPAATEMDGIQERGQGIGVSEFTSATHQDSHRSGHL